MNANELSNQLAALSDSLKTTNSLISRLSKLTFQPGSEPLQGDSVVRIELAQEIHDGLKELEEELEYLKQEAEDYTNEGGLQRRRKSKDGEEVRLSAQVARLSEELVHSRQQFRNAQIKAKFASEEAKRKERELLLESYRKEAEQIETSGGDQGTGSQSATDQLFSGRSKKPQLKQLNKDEILVNASSDVTAALRRTHDLLSTELSRSRFAQETFDESTAALSQLGEDYSNLDTILSNSRNLLGTLLRSQKSDTWYLETAFYILLTTLCWLFFRRLLYGPFIKLPLFFWRVFTFLANWTILKPFLGFVSLTGILTGQPATTLSQTVISSSSRAPLIVQPSASRGAQAFPSDMPDQPAAGVRVGAGGAGAKAGKSGELQGQVSEAIGKMAEASGKTEDEAKQNGEGEKELPRRGDGTVLQERGDVPRNPKKKTFDVDMEDEKQKVKRDEL
ncbi:Sec20 domain protein [Zymoseptoria brevis]|uniref:Sec20 domain protein n=1 Tax=Zymoseptoria brevis TaxID=1047168 RepID=A0A0F4GBE7_9PEZI|nr:Sec20 domain protein [Zymoseptoria brevis]